MASKMAAMVLAIGVGLAGVGVQQTYAAETWDNLVEVKTKKLDAVYLLPGADFRTYTKVMIDKPEVAFKKDWLRDYNRTTMGLTSRLSERDAQRMLERGSTGFEDIFAKAYRSAGYEVVTAPGADVLRLRTGVLNVDVSAPDTMTAGRSVTFAEDAGEATLVLEARDSLSNALLGRAVDRRLAGDNTRGRRTSVSNAGDFELLFRDWARASANGLNELKTLSPLAPGSTAAVK